MNLLICDETNQAAFRAQLKALAPEAAALLRGLYEAGLIDGLRGAALAPLPPGLPWRNGVPVTLSAETERRLSDAAYARGGCS